VLNLKSYDNKNSYNNIGNNCIFLPGLIAKWTDSHFYDKKFSIISIIALGLAFWGIILPIGSIAFLWVKWLIS